MTHHIASCRYVMQTYARPELVFTHGEGARLYDAHGKEYLDFAAGIAVNALGIPPSSSKCGCMPFTDLYLPLHALCSSPEVYGVSSMSVGHSDPRWLEAVVEQAGTLAHTSNLFHSVPQVSTGRSACFNILSYAQALLGP